ncbi:LamG-like jellyroll fold domain-containing protein, partial [Idiomarina baltica]
MSLCLLMFSLFAASAVSHAKQYEFPKDIGKKNKPFEQCTAVNANSGGVSITCPGSVFTALNGSDEIRFKKTSQAELIITGNTVIKSTINNKQSIPLLLRFQTQNSVKIDASSTIKADIFANGSITSDGVIDGNLYTDKDLINNRVINGNVDAEGNIRNNGSGVINGSINVDGDLWNDGQINGTYANAKCTDSSQSNACGNKPLNVDETCNINANEGPCTGGNNVGYQLVGDWHFDESSWTGEPGEVLNSASSSLSGTAVGQPTTSSFSPAIAGNIGTCRYGRFGGDDFVRVPQPQQLSASESVSLSMWFNISASAQRSSSERYQTLLIYGEGPTEGPNGRFEVYRRVSDGALYFEIRDSLDRIHNVSVPGQQVFDGNWHHIAATYDAQSDDINLYIDGVLKATAGVSNRSLNPLSSRANLYIGGQSFAGHGVNGSIDEVTVATGVYSSQKVNQLFNRSRPCGAVDTLKQCSDIWDQALTSGNNSLVNIRPDVPPYGQQLPRTLDPIDYLRQGSFANVGEDYQTPAPTSRVYIDGSLTIEQGARLNQNDDADNFMLIVNGDLTIERDVRINGYIYATGDIFLANAGEPWFLFCFEANTSIVNGALAAAGDIYQTGCGQPAQINYQQPGVDIQGGGYCTVGTAAPLQPILKWSMNDGPWTTNTDVLDGSKNLLNGQAKQGLEWQQASASSALPVDENGMGTCGYGYFKRSAKQYIELPDDPVLDLTNEYTIALWARYSTTPDSGLMTLVSKDTNYELHVTSSGQINWWWQGQRGVHSLTSTQRFDDGEWHYVVARFKSGKQTLTVDNEVIIDASINDKPTTNNSSLRLGADKEGDGNRFFDGAIDEFQMFDSYLSGNDIKRLMDQRSVCQASGNQCYSLNMAGQVFGNDWLSYSKDENYSPKLVEAHNEQYLELT